MINTEQSYIESLMKVLREDNETKFKKYLKVASGQDGLLTLLNKKIDGSYEEDSDKEQLDGNLKNTIIWSLFRHKSYKCFKALTECAGSILNFEVALRPIECYKEFGGKDLRMLTNTCFINLISSRKSSNEILPWLQETKEYWMQFFETYNGSEIGFNDVRIRAGVIKVLQRIHGSNIELLIALHKVEIVNLEDVKCITEVMKIYGETRGVVRLAKHTMSSVENEELLRKYQDKENRTTQVVL